MPHQEALNQYSRHTPRILRRQLILQLAEQYLNGESLDEPVNINSCQPSIQRFYGALLFVDISGFTALSLRLNVEELKNHINEYFTKMLDIVDKHDGDVVKFAGDALFIIWECYEPHGFDAAGGQPRDVTKIALEKALECSKEINESCGNHKVVISSGPKTPIRHNSSSFNDISTASLPSISTIHSSHSEASSPPHHHGHSHGSLLSPINSIRSSTSSEEECAYLNVHSGISYGLMAGIDIGADNRWEYFLIGDPLSKVAEAESQACSGDVIMCPESHALVHNDQKASSSFTSILNAVKGLFRRGESSDSLKIASLQCGCTLLKNGYCKVSNQQIGSHEKKKNRRNKGGPHSPHEDFQQHLMDGIRADIKDVYVMFQSRFIKEYLKHSHSFRKMNDEAELTELVLQQAFTNWAEVCLTEDIARHVHAVMRSEFTFTDASRMNAYEKALEAHYKLPKLTMKTPSDFLIDPAISGHSTSFGRMNSPLSTGRNSPLLAPIRFTPQNSPGPSRTSSPVPSASRLASSISHAQGFYSPATTSEPSSPIMSLRDVTSDSGSLSTGSLLKLNKDNTSANTLMSSRNAVKRRESNLLRSSFSAHPASKASFIAEIRTVTVMFVKIAMPAVELLIDSSKRPKIGGSHRFLAKTVNERVADQLLLNRFQKSLVVLSGSFSAHGGQMRQFIVDDKGTVCIGTFGLRGSVSDDNAAAALEAAHTIVVQLQALGLQCSIGVTVGRAYCGLVGSSNRHEYAVMGPSTNLSARLMCKAPMYGVICDGETRQRDRTHGFQPLADIIAKGYSAPVPTFKPLFPEVEAMLTVQMGLQNVMKGGGLSIRINSTDDFSVRSNGSAEKNCKIIERLIGNKNQLYHRDKHNVKVRMHGRSNEVSLAINFLFNDLVDSVVFDGRSPVSRSLFDYQHSSLFVGISGPHGIGKSCLLSAVTEQISTVIKCNPNCNIQVFKTRYDRFFIGVPFIAWKPIIQEMIIRIYRLKNISPKRKKSFGVGLQASSIEVEDAVNYFLSRQSAKLRHLLPLFGYMTIIPTDTAALNALEMDVQEKLRNCMDLLIAVIQMYTVTSKNVVFIVMDDIQNFDEASLLLLLEVYAFSNGVAVLFTGRSYGSQKAIREAVSYEGGRALSEFITTLQSAERFLAIELDGLDVDATKGVVSDALISFKIEVTDPSIFEKVYDVCGGNPFYAYEIAKSLAEHKFSVANKTLALHSVRIEEVICHRFDQLRNSAQSLLKMAAVACSNGSTFSLSMLSEIGDADMLKLSPTGSTDSHDGELPIHVKLALLVHSVLRSESFICITDKTAANTEVTVEMLLENNYTFEFNISVEQLTIYNLLLDDQKHAIHEGIAEYYKHRRGVITDPTVDDFIEEGFHWQSACMMSNAMVCYYEAYIIEADVVKRSEYLDHAFNLFSAVKDNTEIYPDPRGISFLSLQGLTEDAFKNEGKSRAVVDLSHNESLTLERVFQIFDGDSSMLGIGLNVMIETALQRIRRFEDPIATQLLLEDTLQMILLTKTPFLMSSRYLAKLMNSVMEIDASFCEINPGEMHFCLYDSFPLYCLRGFSVYLMNYVRSTAFASDYSRKVAYIANQFLQLARSEESTVHIIQALCLNALIQNKLSNIKSSLQFAEELQTLFVFEEHAKQLTDIYGSDQVIYLLIRTSKCWFLSGEVEKASSVIASCSRYIMLTSDLYSLTSSVFRIISVMAFAEKYTDAHEVLVKYDRIARTAKTHAREQISWKVLSVYYEWLSRRIRHMAFKNLQNVRVLSHDSTYIDEMIGEVDQLLKSEHDKRKEDGSTFVNQYRHEILIMLADLCVLKIDQQLKGSCDETEILNVCTVCCKRLQIVMDVVTVDTRDIFNKANAIKIATLIVPRVGSLGCVQECLTVFRKTFSTSIISELKIEAQISQLHALCTDLTTLQHLLY